MSTEEPIAPTAAGEDAGVNETPVMPGILVQLEKNPPPAELPQGWVLRRSRQNPSVCYYYSLESGVSRWDPPSSLSSPDMTETPPADAAELLAAASGQESSRSILKRSASSGGEGAEDDDRQVEVTAGSADDTGPKTSAPPSKRRKAEDGRKKHSSSSSKRGPDQVRVLHILKKHKDCRRPASWRNPKITDTREMAVAELMEVIAILKESEGDAKELRATFEELAKTESDCPSHKRGGDLGFFGRKKMQPNFEKASFGLKIGELSGVVETSSGAHVILRLG